MNQCQGNGIKTLSKQLELLRITKEDISEETTEYTDKMLVVLALAIVQNEQVVMLKSMILDSRWFNRNRIKFEDWWKEVRLFLKNNRIIETDNKITTILVWLRGSVAGIINTTITDLNSMNMFLGCDWLVKHNPEVN